MDQTVCILRLNKMTADYVEKLAALLISLRNNTYLSHVKSVVFSSCSICTHTVFAEKLYVLKPAEISEWQEQSTKL